MDNNENNNVNLQNDLNSQIMMGGTPDNSFNQQPQTPINQGLQFNATQDTQVNSSDEEDFIAESSVVEESKQEPIKKGRSKKPIIIVILLLIALGLSGYIVYDKYFSNTTNTTKDNTITENKTQKDTTKKEVLYEDDSKEIVYASIDEKHSGVVRRIPYVNIKSKYAEEINDEITKLTKNGYLEGQVKNSYLEYPVDFHYYVNDEYVSVIFSWGTEASSVTYSKIYNINQYTGAKVANTELLAKANINEKDLNNTLVESYKKARPFDSIENKDMWKDCYQKDLDTLSNGKIKGMFLMDSNNLTILFDLNYPAGATIGEALLNVSGSKVMLNPVTLQ